MVEDLALADRVIYVFAAFDVGEGIAVNDSDVGAFADLEASGDIINAEELGALESCGFEDLHIIHAGDAVEVELGGVSIGGGVGVGTAGVGADAHLYTIADGYLQGVSYALLGGCGLFDELTLGFIYGLNVGHFHEGYDGGGNVPGAAFYHFPGDGVVHVIAMLDAGETGLHTELQGVIIHEMGTGGGVEGYAYGDDRVDLLLGKLDIGSGTDADDTGGGHKFEPVNTLAALTSGCLQGLTDRVDADTDGFRMSAGDAENLAGGFDAGAIDLAIIDQVAELNVSVICGAGGAEGGDAGLNKLHCSAVGHVSVADGVVV